MHHRHLPAGHVLYQCGGILGGDKLSPGVSICIVFGGGDTGRGLAQSTGEYLCSIVVGAKENTWQGTAQPRGEYLCSVGCGVGGGGSVILCVVGIGLLGV